MQDQRECNQVAEFDLGQDDVLVVTCEAHLTQAARESIRASLSRVLERPGRKAVVLDGGLKIHVIKRPAIAGTDAGSRGPTGAAI